MTGDVTVAQKEMNFTPAFQPISQQHAGQHTPAPSPEKN